VVKLLNGGTFNIFGYGDAALGLYRIWGDNKYGIQPKDVKKYQVVIDIGRPYWLIFSLLRHIKSTM
jgi:hypothetical protein